MNDSEQEIQAKLKEIIGQSLRKRMEGLCQGFISSGEYSEIYETLSAVEVLIERVKRLESESAPESWGNPKPESTLSRVTHAVVKVLEDLLLNAMDDVDVGERARKGLLLYQIAPDITLQ